MPLKSYECLYFCHKVCEALLIYGCICNNHGNKRSCHHELSGFEVNLYLGNKQII